MQASHNLLLPKLKLIVPLTTTKSRSSYSHLTIEHNRHLENENNLYKRLDGKDKDK